MNKKLFRLSLLTLALLLVVVPLAAAQDDDDDPTARVIPDLLYAREQPSTAAAIVGELPVGTLVVLEGREEVVGNGIWLFVTANDVTAWVYAPYLQIPADVNIALLPIVSESGLASATAGTTTTDTTDTTDEDTEDSEVTTTTTTAVSGLAGTTNTFVNFRSGPGLQFPIFETVSANITVDVLARNADSTWLSVVVGDTAGWMFAELVDVAGLVSTLPVQDGTEPVAAQPSVSTGTTDEGGATVTRTGNVYDIAIGVSPNGANAAETTNDGRLNPITYLGYPIFYCIDENGWTDTGSFAGGGIVVNHWGGPTPGVVFYATEAQINRVSEGLIKRENGYELYRLSNGNFQFNGLNIHGEAFAFQFDGCNPGVANAN